MTSTVCRCIGWLAVVLLASGCERRGYFFPYRQAILEIPYAGDRGDAPPLAERGNASFESATFDDAGKLLITALSNSGVQVWDARTGALLASIQATAPNGLWMIDSRRQRLLALKPSERGLHLFDLRTGGELSKLPEETGPPARAAGLTGDGSEVLLFKPGWLEVWQLDLPLFLQHQAQSNSASVRSEPGRHEHRRLTSSGRCGLGRRDRPAGISLARRSTPAAARMTTKASIRPVRALTTLQPTTRPSQE
jgi:hypothetical protein